MESFIQKQEKLLEAIPRKVPEGEEGREVKESSMQEDTDGLSTSEHGTCPDTDPGELNPSAKASGYMVWNLNSSSSCRLSLQGLC